MLIIYTGGIKLIYGQVDGALFKNGLFVETKQLLTQIKIQLRQPSYVVQKFLKTLFEFKALFL